MTLCADELRAALETIVAWRADPEASAACPRCSAAGLSLEDRSARPYAEWYQLNCAGCGLNETIHIPLGSPTMSGLD